MVRHREAGRLRKSADYTRLLPPTFVGTPPFRWTRYSNVLKATLLLLAAGISDQPPRELGQARDRATWKGLPGRNDRPIIPSPAFRPDLMAFSIFSKPAPKPKGSAPRDAGPPKDADIPADNHTREGKSTIWKPLAEDIEVTESQPGLCPALENAALLFANNQADAARKLLAESVQREAETKRSSLAWAALFDLLHRAGERQAYEDFSLKYVVVFERSAPVWDERREAKTAKPQRPTGKGFVAFTGRLTLDEPNQLPALKKVTDNQPQAQLDVTGMLAADDDACRAFADLLRQLRRRPYPLQWATLEHLHRLISEATAVGEQQNEGHWLLLLEIWQWLNDPSAFDECAINYAVTFEVSPPSWEPLTKAQIKAVEETQPAPPAAAAEDQYVCLGNMLGPADSQVSGLFDYIERHPALNIDMSGVDRMDFVCAGALFNALTHKHAQGKPLRIVGVSPIIQALLMLIGINTACFQSPKR